MAKAPDTAYKLYLNLDLYKSVLAKHGPNSVFIQRPFGYDPGTGKPVYQPYIKKANPDTRNNNPILMLIGYEYQADLMDTKFNMVHNGPDFKERVDKFLRWGKLGMLMRRIKLLFIKE